MFGSRFPRRIACILAFVGALVGSGLAFSPTKVEAWQVVWSCNLVGDGCIAGLYAYCQVNCDPFHGCHCSQWGS